ncbi:MAG: hypothetical protein ACUVV1_08060 [Fimbriimonadales bacterium]
MDGLVGLLFLGIALAAVGLVDLALFRGLTADYLTLLRQGGNRVVLRGALVLGGVAFLVVVLGAAAQNYPEESPARGGIVLIVVLLGLLLGLAFLVGYGATAWSVGERVLELFGVAQPHPGWGVLIASLLIPCVVWIPVFGWALGLYWVASTLGAVIHRVVWGSPPAMPASSGE